MLLKIELVDDKGEIVAETELDAPEWVNSPETWGVLEQKFLTAMDEPLI